MRRQKLIERLKEIEPAIRAQGVTALYVYGSHARDDASENSDVDVFVDVPPGHTLGLDAYMDIYEMLKAKVGVEIDYSTRAGLVDFYRPAIEREALKVF